MSEKYNKIISTHKWGNQSEYTSTNGYIISAGTYARSVAYINELANEAKLDFPELTDEDIEPFTVTRSSYNQGFSGVRFNLSDNTVRAGYTNTNQINFEHS